MQDLFLYSAGALGILISVIHGYLGQTRVVGPAQTPTKQTKRVLEAIMLISAVYWFAAGVLLLVTPAGMLDADRSLIVYAVAFVYLAGSLGNLWATRGRHFGWALLAIASGLAIAGA